ncbi:MAG: hypothetical protein JXR77_18745 [Lentisphaeria bacterium]|nr:hypothetical protein [Lentisphaeria bacterium]
MTVMPSVGELVGGIRARLLGTSDTVCLERASLVTEAFREHAEAPMPLRRAHAFAHVLRHMTLDLHSNPVFAGNTSARPRAWMLVPEHGLVAGDTQVFIENDGLEGILDGAIPQEMSDFWRDRSVGGGCDPGHLAVDLDTVVHRGLRALVARVEALAGRGSPEQQTYRQAMRLTLCAVMDWAGRYAAAASAAADSVTEPVLRACHRRVAAACRRVPAEPARDLFEGLQAIVFVHLALAIEGHGMSVSIGLPDRVLAPLLDPAAEAGGTADLIAAFLLKITANSVFGRGSKTQAITVGGCDHEGKDASNPLTRAFLEAADRARVGDPHVFLRWHDGLEPGLKTHAAELLSRGLSMPLLVHDRPTIAGLVGAGISPEDAARYCIIGCNELGIPGLSAESANCRAGTIQLLGLLNRVLLQNPAPDRVESPAALLPALETALEQALRDAREHWVRHFERLPERAPVPFSSALMNGCIEAGDDMIRAMKYRLPGLYERGLTNAANAMAAIEELVFNRKELSLAELVEALRGDLRDESLRRRLRQAPRWGNDDPAADRWALELLALRERVLRRIDAEFGQSAHLVCHVVRSLHHVDGRRIAASPDGRRGGSPVADSIGAEGGTSSRGPTAVLKSVSRIDTARYYRGGTNLNLTLPKGPTRPQALLALMESFFAAGGQELQVNCLHPEELRAAQAHPGQHGDLVVRFAGLSARFVDLSRQEQNEIIARTESF